MALVLALAAVLATGAAGGTQEDGVELSTVTLAGNVHFLGSFDSPFTYDLSPTRDRFAYVPGASGSPSDELRISDLRGPDVVVKHAFITDLAWAPAGHPIAMAATDGIWLVEPDGTGLRRVADFYGFGLAWSPDSRELALTRRERGSNEDKISVLTIATGAVRDVAVGTGPAWSPDGASLLYTWSDYMAHQLDEIRLVPAQGGSWRLITHGWAQAWSPDGRRIAYTNPTRNTPAGLWVMRINGGEGSARLLSRRASAPMWLPNGRSIAFVETHRSATCGHRTTVSTVPATGGKVSRVLASRSLVQPLAWNPKGKKLFYVKFCA
jgi:Tol biopolymer transport system component